MKTSRTPDAVSIPFIVNQLIGSEISALALVCAVGEGADSSVAAFITPGPAANSAVFSHALEMERSYSDMLLDFDHPEPPFYGRPIKLNMRKAARSLGVDKVLCLVALDRDGVVSAVRDYDGLEVTLLEAANTQFERFKELIDGNSSNLSSSSRGIH